RLWTYVRDDRPAGCEAASAVWFAYSPDRKGEHPARHLKNYKGILQADGYAGFNQLYEKGNIIEAACFCACEAQVPRSMPGASISPRQGSVRAYRRTIRNRKRNPGAICGCTS